MNDEKIPGLNAPMTSGQKWAVAYAVIAVVMNLLALYLLATGRLGL